MILIVIIFPPIVLNLICIKNCTNYCCFLVSIHIYMYICMYCLTRNADFFVTRKSWLFDYYYFCSTDRATFRFKLYYFCSYQNTFQLKSELTCSRMYLWSISNVCAISFVLLAVGYSTVFVMCHISTDCVNVNSFVRPRQ